ncbi:MAG: hypothetical protein A2Y92_02485 [Chloroflexi bacterium RBG_13_57_8]|nr:MAG: hypothetical protein A2Y92_02485 [Chloroflexi bacterium RBG_13_57_8]
METAIISIICIALIVFGGMTMSRGFMTSVDASTTGLGEMGQRDETIMRTGLTAVGASLSSNDTVQMVVENSGQVKLADFDKWDVFIQYYDGAGDYHVVWLPYVAGAPADNEWGIAWLRLGGQPETFEPNVLNPGEQMMIRAQVNPAVGDNTTNMVVAVTPSGITVSAHFSP